MIEIENSTSYGGLPDNLLTGRLAEDENRAPHEKEWGFHVEGDSDRATWTSFKRVHYEKLLKHPEVELKRLNVVDTCGIEGTASVPAFLQKPDLTAIGATGTIPVGCLSAGTRRNSDSHARVVKY